MSSPHDPLPSPLPLTSEGNTVKTFRIELKVLFNDERKYDALHSLLRRAADKLQTSAAMISDGRAPQVAITADDWFEAQEEIKRRIATEDSEEGVL